MKYRENITDAMTQNVPVFVTLREDDILFILKIVSVDGDVTTERNRQDAPDCEQPMRQQS